MKTIKNIWFQLWLLTYICLLLLITAISCHAQTEVLHIDSTQREKIESFTDQNTFPDLIRFIKDADGNYIVGFEILRDPAYEKLGTLNSKEQPLKEFIEIHSDTIVYKPKTELTETKNPP